MSIRSLFVFVTACLLATAVPVRAQPADPVDDAARSAFVEQLLTASRSADCAAIEHMVDFHAIVARALDGIPLQAPERMGLELELRRTMFAPNSGFGSLLCAADGTWRLVYRDNRRLDDRDAVRFRLQSRGGGAVLVAFALARTRERTVRIVDVFQASVGRWYSAEVRDNAVPLGGSDTAFARTLDARGRLLAQHFPTIRRAMDTSGVGDLAGFEAAARDLPEGLRTDPLVLRMRVGAAQRAGDSVAYGEAIDEVLRLQPDSVLGATLAIDAYTMRGEYARALEMVELTEQLDGQDPFWDLIRGNLLGQLGRAPAAFDAVLRAARGDRDLAEAWSSVLQIGASLGRDGEALEAHSELTRLGAVPPAFAGDPLYAHLRDVLAGGNGRRQRR